MTGYHGRLSELIYKYPMQVGLNKSICIPLHKNEKFKNWIYSSNEDYPNPTYTREVRLEFFSSCTYTARYSDEKYFIQELCMLSPAGYTYTMKRLFENPHLWRTYDDLVLMSHNKCNVDDVVNEILHIWYEDFDKDYKFSYYIKPHVPVIYTD